MSPRTLPPRPTRRLAVGPSWPGLGPLGKPASEGCLGFPPPTTPTTGLDAAASKRRLGFPLPTTPTPGLGTPASERWLGFSPSTAPTPSSMHLPGGAVRADHINEVIGRILSRVRDVTGARVRRDDAGRSCSRRRGTPSTKRRPNASPSADTTTPKRKRGRAGAAEERTVDVTGCITRLVRGDTDGDDVGGSFRRGMPSKRRLDDSPYSGTTTTPRSKRTRTGATERPVEVIGRIRNLTTGASALEVQGGGKTVRVHGAAGGGVSCRRDFTLDGVSVAEEGLEAFYARFVRSRVEDVRAGAKCTVIVYGPTASGKSHTMFGCAEEPGVVYRALWDLLDGGGGGEDGANKSVKVSVLEIYNEDVYDLLDGSVESNASGNPKAGAKVRLDAVGTKATYIYGNEAGKIAREVTDVEKRRAMKSTGCNARSSRSHCMIILDVPSVGGRLMLLDMAGSENIEAAGRTGHEAKSEQTNELQRAMQLKLCLHSKLTMLLRDSFDDDGSKILMILCASPDLEQLHKTLSTLEYGARAKSITRAAAHASTPKDKMSSKEAQILLKDDELARLRVKLSRMEAREADIITKAAEETRILRGELRTTEEQMLMQQQELVVVKQRLVEVDREKLDMEEESHLAWRVLIKLTCLLAKLGWRWTAHDP